MLLHVWQCWRTSLFVNEALLQQTMERNIIPFDDYKERSYCTRAHIILPFKIMSSTNTGLGRQDSGVVLSQHAVVSRPALHVNLLLSHHAWLSLSAQQAPQLHWLMFVFTAWTYTRSVVQIHVCCFYVSYLVVQVPGLIVFFCALPAKDGLVVYLDELPFRTVTEMSKKTAEANDTIRAGQ